MYHANRQPKAIAAPLNALKIACISVVKNESDIIEQFVRHNCLWVDILFIIDNNSSDGTRDILRALQKEGLPLVILDDPHLGHSQSDRLTALLRQVVMIYPIDAVLLLDADEFFVTASRSVLEKQLQKLKPGQWYKVPWSTQIVSPSQKYKKSQDPLSYIKLRRKKEQALFGKIFTQYKSILRCDRETPDQIVIAHGNHEILNLRQERIGGKTIKDCVIAHYPVRSPQQIKAKILSSWMAHLAMAPHAALIDCDFHWRDLYGKFLAGGDLSPKQLYDISLHYGLLPHFKTLEKVKSEKSPIRIICERRYQKMAIGPDPVIAVTRTAEQFLSHGEDRVKAIINEEFKNTDLKVTLPLDLPPLRDLMDRTGGVLLDPLCGYGTYLRAIRHGVSNNCVGLTQYKLSEVPHTDIRIYALKHWHAVVKDLYFTVGFLMIAAHNKPKDALQALNVALGRCTKRILVAFDQVPQKFEKKVLSIFAADGWHLQEQDTALARLMASTDAMRQCFVFHPKIKDKPRGPKLPSLNYNLPPFPASYQRAQPGEVVLGTHLSQHNKCTAEAQIEQIKTITRKRAGGWLMDQISKTQSHVYLDLDSDKHKVFQSLRGQIRMPREKSLLVQPLIPKKMRHHVWQDSPAQLNILNSACRPEGDESFELVVEAYDVPLNNWSELVQIGDNKEEHSHALCIHKNMQLSLAVHGFELGRSRNVKYKISFDMLCGSLISGHRDHIVGIVSPDLGMVQTYFNGKPSAYVARAPWKTHEVNKIWIGSRSFRGQIVSANHYKGLLTDKEVSELYKKRKKEFNLKLS